MEIENKTLEILDLVREKVLSPDEALPHILRLFSVIGRREQLISFFNWYQDDPKELSNNETIVDAYLDEINCT